MKTTLIYALCEPGTRTVRYIGKSDRPQKRLTNHLCKSARQESHLGCWLRKLKTLGQSPSLVVLREVSYEQWESAEARYIRLATGLGIRLVNATEGGGGCPSPTPETRAKMRQAQGGENHPMFGKCHSAASRLKISQKVSGCLNPNYGKVHSEKIRKKISEATSAALRGSKNPMFGKKHSQESKDKIRASKLARNQKEI